MSSHKLIIFYLPIILILIGCYRNSWIPGGSILVGKEIWLILFLSMMYFIVVTNINTLFKFHFKLFSGSNKYITSLIILLLISTIIFNTQEIVKPAYLVRLIDYFFYFLIFFLMVPKFLIQNSEYFKKLVLFTSIFGLISSILGIVLLLGGVVPDPKFAGTLVSFIEQPNYVVFITNLGIIFTLYYLDWNNEKFSFAKKTFFFFSILIQFIATLLTLSRGGYIGIGLGLVAYFLFKFRRKIVFVLPLLVTISILIIPPFFTAKGFTSFIARLYLLVPAYYMMTKDYASFLWGFGVSNTFDEFIKYNHLYNIGEFHLNNPHNVIVSMILMFGVLFTVLMIFYVCLMMKRLTVKAFKEYDKKRALYYGFVIATIVMLVSQSLFDSEIIIIEFFSLQYLLIFLGLLRLNTESDIKTNCPAGDV